MNDIKVLEKILINKGRIISHTDLKNYFSSYKNINNKINSLTKKGWLVNLKRGQYYLAKLGSLGYAATSFLVIANRVGEHSFVSFEAALKHHGFFDQGLKKIRSISLKQYRQKLLEGVTYQYIKVKSNKYFGFQSATVDGDKVLVAAKERALLDLIEYRRTAYSVSLSFEKLKSYSREINFKIMLRYLESYSQVTIKTIALFFQHLNLETTKISRLIKTSGSTSRLFSSSNTFSSRWRLYYDDIIFNI